MRKAIILSMIMLLACTVLFGAAEGESAGETVKLTWSSAGVPADAHTIAMMVFEEEVEKLSGGQIQVDIYHSGQLFTQEGEKTALRRGVLDIAYLDGAWLANDVPYLSMLTAVYTFSGYDHMTRVLNGEIGKEIFEDVAQKTGIRPLSAFYLGTRQLNLRDVGKVVRTPQDMKGVKFRVPNSPSWIALGKALGGNPTPLNFNEVYLGLKTGAIDGQDNPLPTDKNAKFYEVTDYIILTDHVVGQVWPTINEEKWQSLTDQQQAWVLEALETARQACDKQNLDAEAELVEFFRGEGLTVIEDPDKEAFAEYARWSYQNESPDISAPWDWDLYDRIQAEIK